MASETEEIGWRSEESFFRALRLRTEKTPLWFRRIYQAAPELDVRGIDGFAVLHYPEKEWAHVPIQIKSSSRGAAEYFRTHPAAWLAGVVVFVIYPNESDDAIRLRFYKEIEPVYERRILYYKYLQKLSERPLTIEMRERVEKIRTARATRT